MSLKQLTEEELSAKIDSLDKEREELAAALESSCALLRSSTASNLDLPYPEYVRQLMAETDLDEAVSKAVGGDYQRMGAHLVTVLREHGIKPTDYVIDVGCGSGRVAYALAQSEFRRVRYLGTDISDELLSYARSKCEVEGWRFEKIDGIDIPEGSGQADFVFFFSVFTHQSEVESYLYLVEAKRVLKPGGTILFSFLDYAEKSHWQYFESNVLAFREGIVRVPDVFLSKDAIMAWAEKLGLEVLYLGSPDGGQSRCVLRKAIS